MKYTITEKITKYNQSGKTLNAKGIAIHSTANPGASAYNHYLYFNGAYRGAIAHYFVDWNKENYIMRLVKETNVAWHLGGPIGNNKYIGIEFCEAKTQADFNLTWDRVVELTVDILKRHKWNETNLITHKEHSDKTKESDHQDPMAHFKKFGKTWADFKNDVKKRLNSSSTTTTANTTAKPQNNTNTTTHTIVKGDTLYSISKKYNMTVKQLEELNKGVNSATLKIGSKLVIKKGTTTTTTKTKITLPSGIYKMNSSGTNVKTIQKYLTQLGYNTKGADGIYGNNTKTAIVNFQKKNGLTADGIYGNNTKAKMEALLNK